MIIKPKPFSPKTILFLGRILTWFMGWKFNKLKIHDAEVLKGHSYVYMCNHFGFWDGFFACYFCLKSIYKQEPNLKGFYMMSLEAQMKKNMWLRRIGCFSIAPGTKSVGESLDYAAEILNEPGHLFVLFPQGDLESCHVDYINVKPGIAEILKRVKGNCQLIWSSNMIEYFESLKPSVTFHGLNCGTNHDFNLEKLTKDINEHHKASIKKQFRFKNRV